MNICNIRESTRIQAAIAAPTKATASKIPLLESSLIGYMSGWVGLPEEMDWSAYTVFFSPHKPQSA